jgi:hypothetical protein
MKTKTIGSTIALFAVVTLLCLQTGCATYPATANDLPKEKNVQKIDAFMKDYFSNWEGSGKSSIGADSNGWSELADNGFAFKPISGNGVPFTMQEYKRANVVKVHYEDIQEVIVIRTMTAIVLCGLVDPTDNSHVKVRMRDGKEYEYYTGLGWIFPIWPFQFRLGQAKDLASAFQTLAQENRHAP